METTRILARNLSQSARARLGGVPEVYMDTPENFRVPLAKDVEKLSDLNKIRVEGALRVSIDKTEVNNAVLSEFYTPLTVNNRTRWIDVVLSLDDIPTSFTRMYVVSKNDDGGKWEVEFALPEDHWCELATQKQINTIDYGGFTLSKDNVLASWAAPAYDGDYTPTQDVDGVNAAYGWWPIDFGDWVDRTLPDQNTIKPVKMLAVEDLRPTVNLTYLLKRGFCEIGWTLEGLILQHEWTRRLWAYLLKPQYYAGKGYDGVEYGAHCRLIGRRISGDLEISSLPSDKYIVFSVLDLSGSTGLDLPFQGDPAKWMCGIQNPLPFRAKFGFSVKFTVEAHPAVVIPQTLTFAMFEIDAADTDNETFTGEILSNDASFTLGVAEERFVAFDFEFELNPGQKAALHWNGDSGVNAFIIKPGFWFRCEHANESFLRGDEVDLRTALDPDLNLLDVLKGFVHKANGRLETDYVSRTLRVFPEKNSEVYGSDVPGFLREDIQAIDVSRDVQPNSFKLRFVRPNLSRYTEIAFSDSSDAYIEDLNLPEPLHGRKINNGEDLPNEVTEIHNPLFEPTAERQSELLKQNDFSIVNRPNAPVPFLPVMWDNTDSERSFDIGPRILFAFGTVTQINPQPITTTDLYANYFFDEYDPSEDIGYATQLRTWQLDPSPTLDGNVVFGRTASDLFVNFYLGITQDNRGGIEVDLLQRISMAQYSAYNFRRYFTMNYEGRQLRLAMQSIRDFMPGLTTPVSYFASPVDTDCCDLPCSCRFQECDYYQDFGPYIQQSTMNTLAVTSFKVDGVEKLAVSVPLGQLNIIDIGGGPYVTNLVDALNSIAAPYFVFSYSTRAHATRGMRFFRIKRPVCQTFEIIISDTGDPVYRYTDTEQQEQWFGGSWGAIGYAPNTFTAPDNCITTIEY